MPLDHQRILRYRKQSLQLLESAFDQMRSGRWSRSEDLLWGSLTLAVKGVALSPGEQLDGDEAVREYATQLGRERRDRRIREAFSQLADFGESSGANPRVSIQSRPSGTDVGRRQFGSGATLGNGATG